MNWWMKNFPNLIKEVFWITFREHATSTVEFSGFRSVVDTRETNPIKSRVDVSDGDINFRECLLALIDFKVLLQETLLELPFNHSIRPFATHSSFWITFWQNLPWRELHENQLAFHTSRFYKSFFRSRYTSSFCLTRTRPS